MDEKVTAWAKKLADKFSDAELSELVSLWDSSGGDELFREVNRINAERNPDEYNSDDDLMDYSETADE